MTDHVWFVNDSSIRLWALTGEVLLEMVGHTAIVYSVDAHKSGLVVSGSEDGLAKIWKGDISCPLYFILDLMSLYEVANNE